jgi:DNA-binding NarL/FixJ family response regulator
MLASAAISVIAQQLYVTKRTVETHLTHAFRKLGIGTRTQLTERLAPGRRRPAPGREMALAG